VRIQEKLYIDNYQGKEFSDDEWIKILVENPKLLRRPIVVNGNKAVLANPPENIEEIV
jgi:arsenate reductase-like glutaredoxin family protein